ncbi:unnamed protein product [Penicillium pancosmium]
MNGDEVNLELNLNEPRLEAPEGLSAPAAQGRPPILPRITPLFTALFSPILPVCLVLLVLGKVDYRDVDAFLCSTESSLHRTKPQPRKAPGQQYPTF